MFTKLTPEEEFEYFSSLENLHVAWERVKSSPIIDTKDRLGLKIFGAQTDEHLKLLHENLCEGKYTPGMPFFMLGPKKDKTIRIRTFLNMQDRIVYQAICNTLIENCYSDIAPFANKTIFAHIPTAKKSGQPSKYTFLPAFVKGKGKGKGQYKRFRNVLQNDLKEHISKPDSWMLETDVASFYPSIDHSLLKEMLERHGWLQNSKLVEILFDCLYEWSALNPGQPAGQGVPIGYEASELMATLYLLDIDLQLDLWGRPLTLRRFVDDMYVFMEGKEEIEHFLVEYDLALKRRSLIRKSSKTEILPCTTKTLESRLSENNLNTKLSFVKNVVPNAKGINQQAEIRGILDNEIPCEGSCSDVDVECIRENLSSIAFVLWRYETRDNRLKHIALCILEQHPIKTAPATRYLSLFEGDSQVFQSLLSIIERSKWYSPCRIDCMKAAIQVSNGLTSQLAEILSSWVNQDEDWYLQDAAIDILSEHHYIIKDLIREDIAGKECYLIRAKAWSKMFFQTDDTDEKIRIINSTFDDDHYTLKSLGMYLPRRDITIPVENLNTTNLDEDFEKILLPEPSKEEFEEFSELFHKIFDLDIESDALIWRRMNIKDATQHLRDIEDAESDILNHAQAFHDFALLFYDSYAKTLNPDLEVNSLRDLRSDIHSNISREYRTLSDLRDANEDAEEEKYGDVPYPDAPLYKQVRKIIRDDLHRLEKGEFMRDKVFISYSHEDDEWQKELNKHLKPLINYKNLNVWSDEKIKGGDKWRKEIDEALRSAKVAVLLVTSNFLASEFIHETELPEFFRAAEEGGLKILWVAVSSSNYDDTPLEEYECVNDPSNPLDLLKKPEQAKELVKITKEILDAMHSDD